MSGFMKFRRLFAVLSTITISLFFGLPTHATDFSQQIAFWRQSAFSCNANGNSYPSKEVVGNAADCDDGDMTLFNGLLCASGETVGCNGVAGAQDSDGRWWRAPRRIGWESPEHDVSFSPDQSLGVLNYVVKTGDKASFVRWLGWIEQNRPCLAEIGGTCFRHGWLRFCRDDPDKRCTLRPGDCVRIEETAKKLGTDGTICRRVMRELGLPENVLLPLGDFLISSASVNEPGYPQHLAGVDILFARTLGVDTDKASQAAAILAARTPDNPFFKYLSEGKTAATEASMLAACPSADRLSSQRTEWTWERVDKPDRWKTSMYWECVFLGNLLSQP